MRLLVLYPFGVKLFYKFACDSFLRNSPSTKSYSHLERHVGKTFAIVHQKIQDYFLVSNKSQENRDTCEKHVM